MAPVISVSNLGVSLGHDRKTQTDIQWWSDILQDAFLAVVAG